MRNKRSVLSLESAFHGNGKKYEICYLQKLVQPKNSSMLCLWIDNF